MGISVNEQYCLHRLLFTDYQVAVVTQVNVDTAYVTWKLMEEYRNRIGDECNTKEN